MRAIVFCNGIITDYSFLEKFSFENYFIICADGGVRHSKKLEIIPDVIIGDADSAEFNFSENTKVIKYPTDKDYTDTHLCINYAIDHGCKEIVLIGATGGRLDHEYSHYCLLAYGLERNVRIRILDSENEIWMENNSFTLKKTSRKYVSFFPFGGDVKNFSVKGLKYTTKDITLSCSDVQASSNEFSDDVAEVTFSRGTLLVILSDEK